MVRTSWRKSRIKSRTTTEWLHNEALRELGEEAGTIVGNNSISLHPLLWNLHGEAPEPFIHFQGETRSIDMGIAPFRAICSLPNLVDIPETDEHANGIWIKMPSWEDEKVVREQFMVLLTQLRKNELLVHKAEEGKNIFSLVTTSNELKQLQDSQNTKKIDLSKVSSVVLREYIIDTFNQAY